MSLWDHPICERCWFNYPGNAEYDEDGVVQRFRIPPIYTSVETVVEACCYCNEPTILGARRRDNPQGLFCQETGHGEGDDE